MVLAAGAVFYAWLRKGMVLCRWRGGKGRCENEASVGEADFKWDEMGEITEVRQEFKWSGRKKTLM